MCYVRNFPVNPQIKRTLPIHINLDLISAILLFKFKINRNLTPMNSEGNLYLHYITFLLSISNKTCLSNNLKLRFCFH